MHSVMTAAGVHGLGQSDTATVADRAMCNAYNAHADADAITVTGDSSALGSM